MRVLMVCLGNICRSPIAEGVLRHIAKVQNLDWVIDSAGTESYHIGESPHIYSQKICQKHQIDISGQKARLFQPEDLQRFDKIYALSTDVLDIIKHRIGLLYEEQKVGLFLNELYPGQDKSVTDPWYGPEEGYADVFNIIEKTCYKIVERYR